MKHILELPWGSSEIAEKYDLKTIKGGFQLYNGVLLPRELRPYKAENFSLGKWKEDEENAHVYIPEKPKTILSNAIKNDNFITTLKKILSEEKMAHIPNSETNVEKLSVLTALSEFSAEDDSQHKDLNKHKVLIVTPKSFTFLWRRIIEENPVVTAFIRPLIINYDDLTKMLVAPPAARVTQKKTAKMRSTAKNGVSSVDWNYIIIDHPNQLSGYPDNVETNALINIAGLNNTTKPKVVVMGTSWNNITNYRMIAPTFQTTPELWEQHLKTNGYKILKTETGLQWLGELPKRGPNKRLLTKTEQMQVAIIDRNKLAIDIQNNNNTIMYPISSTIVPYPMFLNGKDRVSYSQIWSEFREWLNLNPKGKDPEGYKRRANNYNRRINRLRERYIVNIIADFERNNKKALVSVEPSEHRVKTYVEKLYKKKVLSSQHTKETNIETIVNDFNYNVINVLITGEKKLFVDQFRYDTLHVVETSLRRVNPTFTNNDSHVVTIVPYMVDTLEENIVKKLLNRPKNLMPSEFEKIYRSSAAKRQQPNALS